MLAGDKTYSEFWDIAQANPEEHSAKSVEEGINFISSGVNVFHVPDGNGIKHLK